MSFKFVYAKELKKDFNCYGHFYTIRFSDQITISCRSVLEIVDNSINQSIPNNLLHLKPDAICIMMNPGSSYPMTKEINDERNKDSDFGNLKNLVLTRPDNTQYQIMRIAKELKWSHIRVINLSDIRNSNSNDFIYQTKQINEKFSSHLHSIFSNQRIKECNNALNSKNKNVILGWGQNKDLIPFAKKCFERISKHNITRVESNVHGLLNLHPSPMIQKKKEEWLREIIKQI